MIRIFLLLCAWSLNAISQAQITLESCKQQARENYPLVRQYDLIQLSEQYTLSNVAKGNLPQISISGKISYQSEATTFSRDSGIGYERTTQRPVSGID